MTTITKPLVLRSLAWQTLRLYGRHFLSLFLVGGLPGLLYTLLLTALGSALHPRLALDSAEVLSPAWPS